MGYGAGGFLVAVGLVLALAVDDTVQGVDLVTVGWILTAVGAVLLLLTAITMTSGRRARSVATTTHADGTQTVRETRSEV
ncbi:hypothetical protein GCM10022215_36730 [Nocardioides fonticola]|uniref:DUF6458 domain-containing protein n=1 Tax=Nocardioides fonticola TaxID=450363 RepID=A0ABP7XXU6_9ACTN